MSPEPEPSLGELVFRVHALERGIEVLRTDFHDQFLQVQSAIRGLDMVPMSLYVSERDAAKALYVSERAGLQRDIEAMGKEVDKAHKAAMASFGVLATAVVATVVGAVSKVL